MSCAVPMRHIALACMQAPQTIMRSAVSATAARRAVVVPRTTAFGLFAHQPAVMDSTALGTGTVELTWQGTVCSVCGREYNTCDPCSQGSTVEAFQPVQELHFQEFFPNDSR